jgi:hypothetical protein
MNTKAIVITSFSIIFGLACFIWGLLWMTIAKDLGNQLENRICICEVES